MMVVALCVGACSPTADGHSSPSNNLSSTTSSSSAVTTSSTVTTTTTATTEPLAEGEYRPGLHANVFLPEATDAAPLVVMVPGGGWRTADPSGFADLAASLAEAGIVALTVEIGAAEDGVSYPDPIEDIHCAVGFGISRAEEAGIRPGPVVLLGHSSGAHLAALAALNSELPECTHPAVPADALVGLAGVYDVDRLPALAYLLFGVSPEEDPGVWEEGNPLLRAALRPELPVLLLHGASDPLVPVSFTDDFAAVLEDGGHDTTVTVIGGADHSEIFLPEISGDVIVDWIEGLGAGG